MNHRLIGPVLVLGAFGAAAALSGCGRGAGASGDRVQTIGLTVQSIADPYFVAIQRGVEAEAKRTGARVALQDGREDIGNQTNIMDNFDVQQVNMIMLNTVDTVGIGPAVTRAHKDGIPIVAVDAEAEGGTEATVISDDEQAARLSGIAVPRTLTWVYTISGVCAGLAGVLYSARLESGQPQGGAGYELDAIAAVILGGTSLSGGVGSVMGTLVGALIIGVLDNGLVLMNVPFFYQLVIRGGVIIAAVLLDRVRTGRAA